MGSSPGRIWAPQGVWGGNLPQVLGHSVNLHWIHSQSLLLCGGSSLLPSHVEDGKQKFTLPQLWDLLSSGDAVSQWSVCKRTWADALWVSSLLGTGDAWTSWSAGGPHRWDHMWALVMWALGSCEPWSCEPWGRSWRPVQLLRFGAWFFFSWWPVHNYSQGLFVTAWVCILVSPCWTSVLGLRVLYFLIPWRVTCFETCLDFREY